MKIDFIFFIRDEFYRILRDFKILQKVFFQAEKDTYSVKNLISRG